MAKISNNIIFVNRFFYPDLSATSQILSDLAFDLAEQGYNIDVLASRMRYDMPDVELPATETIRGVKVCRVVTTRFGRGSLVGRACDYLSFYISCFFTLLIHVKKGTIVVAKTDPPLVSVIAALVVTLKGGILVNWLQDLFPEVADRLDIKVAKGAIGKILQRVRNWSLRKAAMNVVLGTRMQDYVHNEGISLKNISIVPNWSDIYLDPEQEPEPNPYRKQWELEDKFVVGYSGNMGWAHDFDTLIGAADRLQHREDIVFLFIGGGAKREYIETRVRELSLRNVVFKDYQPREALLDSLRVPDVHMITLLPELEGFIVPSKFYGVAAVGRPTFFVGSKQGELGELLGKHKAGHVVEIGEDQQLAALIEKSSNDQDDVTQLGKNALRAYQDNYSRAKAAERWGGILQSASRQS